MKYILWASEDIAKRELGKNLQSAKKLHDSKRQIWRGNESTAYNTKGAIQNPAVNLAFDSQSGLGPIDASQQQANMGINYTFKNLRFIHAQMSANPPVVMARPSSSDAGDHFRADAADRIVRWVIRQYKMQDLFDRCTLNALLYGIGYVKTVWDSMGGDIASFDAETQEITMEGDLSVTVPHPDNVLIDPEARCWSEVRYVFERVLYTVEEALFRWPDKADLIKKALRAKKSDASAVQDEKYRNDIIELYEYYEKGMPVNGMLGRFCVCFMDGTPMEAVRENPHQWRRALNAQDRARMEKAPDEFVPPQPTAYLPYHVLTDIDVPDTVYGKSFIEFEKHIQDINNRLLSTILDCLQAHGVTRLVLPEGSEIAEKSITNSPWDIVKISGAQPMYFAQPMQLPSDLYQLMDRIRGGIDDLAGVNDSMFGQMQRETASSALQYATNQGNMVRRRIFNKYVDLVESSYKTILNLIRVHWPEAHVIQVLGDEQKFETKYFKGSDIDGGFDLSVEYGQSLSLDPMTRREEMLTMLPLFEKAGVDTKQLLRMLKLAELEPAYDLNELSARRQQEIFDQIVKTGQPIQPRELQEHQGMLTFAYQYIMRKEYQELPQPVQQLIEDHIRQREQLAAAKQPAPPPAGGPAPGAGPLPPPPVMPAMPGA